MQFVDAHLTMCAGRSLEIILIDAVVDDEPPATLGVLDDGVMRRAVDTVHGFLSQHYRLPRHGDGTHRRLGSAVSNMIIA